MHVAGKSALSSKDIAYAVLSTAGVCSLMMAVLAWQGRIWWCKSGDLAIYVNQAWNSSHTSQHGFDPYSFTHILHGVLFFWLTGLIFHRLAANLRFLIAVVVEAVWEVFENSNFIIEKYRENTASLDYFGDSIANSFGDLAACALGFYISSLLGWWRSFLFFVLVELALLVLIRDGLILNILMLVYPLEAIKQWQTAI